MAYDVQDFESQVLQRSREVPVVVDFWAPWCGPCKMLGPLIERLATEAAGRWELVKVNTDEHQGLATAFNIASIPAVKLFRDGVVVDEFLGFLPEAELRRWIEKHLPSPATLKLEQAAERIDEGDLAGARTLLDESLREDPDRAAAKLLLAEILLTDEPGRARELLDSIPPDADESAHAQALRVLATSASRPAEDFPDDDLKPSLLTGLQAVRRRDWEAALSAFTDLVERRRGYADGLAADAGKAIFRYLGIRHPVADRYYRRFSSALNS